MIGVMIAMLFHAGPAVAVATPAKANTIQVVSFSVEVGGRPLGQRMARLEVGGPPERIEIAGRYRLEANLAPVPSLGDGVYAVGGQLWLSHQGQWRIAARPRLFVRRRATTLAEISYPDAGHGQIRITAQIMN